MAIGFDNHTNRKPVEGCCPGAGGAHPLCNSESLQGVITGEVGVGKSVALLAATTDEITRRQSQLDAGLKSFNTDARAAIPTQPECCDRDYDPQKRLM